MTQFAPIPLAVLAGAGLAWAGGQGGSAVAGVPIFALSVGLAFAIQWVAFVPAYLARTERYYDLTGSLTYVTVTLVAIGLTPGPDARSRLLAALIIVWAARLGSFLFKRIRAEGADRRFDEVKTSAVRFLVAWTLQGLWVSFTAGAALAALTGSVRLPIGAVGWVGLLVWIGGFAFEVVADAQKRAFRAKPENEGRYIDSGLWAWSRHPNYFGEIVLWTGVAIIAFPVLQGWQYVTLLSPVFVILLLTKVSGIPLLEERADERWGGEPEYEEYKARTPVLVPRPPRGAA